MGRHWAKNEIDIEILTLVDKHKALTGTTISVLASPKNHQKGYDRLKALKKLGLVEGCKYMEEVAGRKQRKTKKVGVLYYLTTPGVAEVKKIKGEEPNGKERNQRPDEESMRTFYQASIILQNIPLEFSDPREFKNEHNFVNFYTVDLLYDDWQIIIQRKNTTDYKRRLLDQSMISESKNLSKRIILCSSPAKIKAMLDFWNTGKNHGPNVRLLLQNDYENIQQVLEGKTLQNIIQTINITGHSIVQYPTIQDGYEYEIDGTPTNVYDLIGFPARVIRKLLKESPGSYIGVADEESKELIGKWYPSLIEKHTLIVVEKAETPQIKPYDPWEALDCSI